MPRSAPVLSLLLITFLAAPAFAGSYDFTDEGPGEAAGTIRYYIEVMSDTTPDCQGYCAQCCGEHTLVIMPEPSKVLAASSTPIEGGVEVVSEFGNPDQTGFRVDLDPSITYFFSDGISRGVWQPYGQNGVCVTTNLCIGFDTDFEGLAFNGEAVAVDAMSWSAIKAQY